MVFEPDSMIRRDSAGVIMFQESSKGGHRVSIALVCAGLSAGHPSFAPPFRKRALERRFWWERCCWRLGVFIGRGPFGKLTAFGSGE